VADEFKIIIDSKETVKFLTGKKTQSRKEVVNLLQIITRDIKQEGKQIIRDTKHVWKSRLINSIFNRVSSSGDTITGEVFTGTDYAIYVHEGTKKHRVGFVDQGGTERIDLVRWAIDHNLIDKVGDQYISTSTGKPIRGITVGIDATKFLENPYQRQLSKFISGMQRVGA
jgi:hypothetical protein